MNLTQDEANQLFELRKIPVSAIKIDFPFRGEEVEIELQNETGRIKFQADINRANKIVSKVTFQLRHKKVFTIRRLDLNGNHKNPPDEAPDVIFKGYEGYIFNREDHIHFYIDGYGERWALPLKIFTEIGISDQDELFEKMEKFFKYCNVESINVRKRLNL
jgi:hypothetical protein